MTGTHETGTPETGAPSSVLSAEDVDLVVYLTTCAPSVHNTQPWRVTRTPGGFTIEADRGRQLSTLDPTGRQLTISCGAAVGHLLVATRGLGWDGEVSLMPTGDDADLIARVDLTRGAAASAQEVALSSAILRRHTDRRRYRDDAVPDAALERLVAAAEGATTSLRLVRASELAELEVLLGHAEAELQSREDYREELHNWVWGLGEQRLDGMPRAAVEHGADRAESLAGRAFITEERVRQDEPRPAEHPTVFVMTTTSDSPADWAAAGMALSQVLLVATSEGLSAQPLGQLTDQEATRQRLRTALGLVGHPQLVLRVGYGEAPLVTPRREVTDVLDQG